MMFLFAVPGDAGPRRPTFVAADGRRPQHRVSPRLTAFSYWMFLFGGVFL